MTPGTADSGARRTGIPDRAQLLEALQFAAHKHRSQRRKDVAASPYINHPIEVATLLATRGAVTDLPTLLAAVLHDTIEDTETRPEELDKFGAEVRSLVLEVTDDKQLPKAERKRLQIEHAQSMSRKAKLVKLGDKIANVRDVTAAPPAGWNPARRREYLDWTENVVRGCRGTNQGLEDYYDRALREGRRALEALPEPLTAPRARTAWWAAAGGLAVVAVAAVILRRRSRF